MTTPGGTDDDGVLQNYVAGEWRSAAGDREAVTDPATGETVATVPFTPAGGVDEAVGEAREAFASWRRRPVEERVQPLFAFKELLEDAQDDLAETLVREHGKTLAEARGELRRGIENVETACGVASTMQAGNLPDAAPGIDERGRREPLGVFVAVTPFNFPGMIPLWFLPYAVATGNAFVLKPSEQTPVTPHRLFELLDEAGFPPGVVNLVHGAGDTAAALVEHDDVAGVSFVGSTPVAEHVYRTAAAAGKRVQAQGGAKNHVVVTETAALDYAAEKTVGSCFACAGERCLANDVVLVEESVYDEFADRVVERAAAQQVGSGLDEETDVGPLISAAHERRVREYVATGVEEGADLLLDGREVAVDGYPDGNFLGPTVFGDVSGEATISREELFGPVLGLAPVSDLDEAIERVNRSRFGNAASLFTDSGSDARRFRREVEVGNVGVNVGTVAPMAFFHFGGRKDSFFGDLHAQGRDAIQFYTDEKVVVERWPDA